MRKVSKIISFTIKHFNISQSGLKAERKILTMAKHCNVMRPNYMCQVAIGIIIACD